MHLNRSLIVGVVGAGIVAAAISLTYILEDQPKESRIAEAPDKASADKFGNEKRTASNGPATPSGESLKAPKISTQPIRPKFDVVRISPTGHAVIAGRAQPYAEVTVSDKEKELGKVKADARGEWVLIPKNSFKSGAHELSISSRIIEAKSENSLGAGGNTSIILSKEKIVLVVPEQGKDIAGRSISGKSGALVIAVPRDGGGGITVLQKPAAGVIERSTEELAEAKKRIERVERKLVETKIAAIEQEKLKARVSDPKLSVDSIDYNEAGKIEMTGRAPGGSRVQIYLNNKPVATTKTNKSGKWRVEPAGTVSPGFYKLRVDQITESGKVIARIELPFARAKPLGDLPRNSVVLIQPGNSLWRIARNTYGQGLSYAVIYEANRDQIRNPDLIYPGQVFILPKIN